MDQLSKDAMAARRRGLSYGQYMAQKEQKPPPVRYPKKKPAAEKKCVICGQPLTPGRRKKFCSDECAGEALLQTRRKK